MLVKTPLLVYKVFSATSGKFEISFFKFIKLARVNKNRYCLNTITISNIVFLRVYHTPMTKFFLNNKHFFGYMFTFLFINIPVLRPAGLSALRRGV